MAEPSLSENELASILRDLTPVLASLTREEQTRLDDRIKESGVSLMTAERKTSVPPAPVRTHPLSLACAYPIGKERERDLFLQSLTEVMEKMSRGSVKVTCQSLMPYDTVAELEEAAQAATAAQVASFFVLMPDGLVRQEDRFRQVFERKGLAVGFVPMEQLSRHFLYVDTAVSMLLARKKKC